MVLEWLSSPKTIYIVTFSPYHSGFHAEMVTICDASVDKKNDVNSIGGNSMSSEVDSDAVFINMNDKCNDSYSDDDDDDNARVLRAGKHDPPSMCD